MLGLARNPAALPRTLTFALTVLALSHAVAGQDVESVAFSTRDGGRIHGRLIGGGGNAVVLAHGAVFDKESWQPVAAALASQGCLVLAIDFRGYGSSTAGSAGRNLYLDVLAAVDFLEDHGARTVSLVGASMGGAAVARAATEAEDLHKVVLLAPAPIPNPEAMRADLFLYVASQRERGLARIREQFERAPAPKRLELLDSAAHAQHLFKTDLSERLTRLIVEFLAE